ncbi:hypothetical protein [Companilactobacillus mishanensis]|uniref:Uncharacterized protein n=1 Tax=Companilactobacillus mishanensis TaxID=2486008 RepID=A0A5P0ZKZ0_9LACO|nr:hypothetical protein [Companilactobacillus mishanensis]MQS44541.1 hypothetical protein [Companilactobacillus mishanensis]MQS53337.1 hypothetical protein [Companilactobacillus mishanensis]MQS88779.1 hypothetical protein [Companilactobacillus mishanensis]
MSKSTNAQKSGWIVWWINNVILVFGGLFIVLFLSNNGKPTPIHPTNAMLFIFFLFALVLAIALQVAAYFMIKFLHRDLSYIYPAVLVAFGFFCGAYLYFIPGLWGIMYNNHAKLNK